MSAYLSNKTVLVTGGSDGIGKALVEACLLAGAKVATCGRNSDKLYQLQVHNPGRPLHTIVADVSSEQDCQRLIDSTVQTFGGIDILINNAGISMRGLFGDTELNTLRQLMDTNFWGAVYCTKYAMPYIIESKGDIVGVSSIAGNRGLPGRSGYSASKHALQGWLEALRTELLYTGVNVMWISPWFTSSNIRHAALDNEAHPHGNSPMNESKMMRPEACAAIILKAVEARRRSVVLTPIGKFTVFLNGLFPKLTDRLVRKFFYRENSLVK